MKHNNVTLTVVIHGRNNNTIEAREYRSPVDFQNYIEGRPGSDYSLRIVNNNQFRVLAVPSVDGLSVLDGKPAGQQSSGYVMAAGETLDIPGWVVDSSTAAKFAFAADQASGYSAQSGQGVTNTGVIGLMVFREDGPVWPVTRGGLTAGRTLRSFGAMSKGLSSRGGPGDMLGGAAMMASNCIAPSASPSWSDESSAGLEAFGAVADSAATASAVQPEEQKLSTAFGDATQFGTTKVEFKRGDLLAQIVLFYKDARGLKKIGIDVSQPIASGPNPFPADAAGCQPPAGWSK